MKNIVNVSALLLAMMLLCLSEAYAQSGWFSQSSGTTNTLNGVSFTDANTGTAVGNVGTILRTTNGGALWTSQTSGTTLNLLRVSFIDANTGTAVGTAGRILRTTNGGALWTTQTSGTTNILLAVFFTDANTGTAAGSNGTILRTTNGGATWVSQSSGTTNALLGVSFTNANTGTAVGGSGTIRRTTNGGVVSVEEERHAGITGGFLVSQNHPNPFNPTTMISFSLPSKSFVSLEVFDVLGKAVVTLIAEELPAGSYVQRWNAAGLPSGAYFYRLKARDFIETRKMILLR